MENTASGNTPDTFGKSAGNASRSKAVPVIEQVTERAHQWVDKTAASVTPAADWLAEQGENLNASQKKVVNDASAYISANPLMSVGVALLAGVLLNRLMRR